jgi:hypothetical protein
VGERRVIARTVTEFGGGNTMKKLILILALIATIPLVVPHETRADIAADNARDVYTGNGSTTAFTYNFKILTSAGIAVYQAGTLKTLTTHYTVTGVGNDAGGTVVFVTAPANNEQVVLLRNQPIEQITSYVDGAISASTIERDFDRQTAINQQQQETIERTLRYPITITPTSGLTLLPTPVAEKCIGYDGAGTSLALYACGGSGGGSAFTSSAGLAGILIDEIGTGFAVFSDSPVFTTQITAPKHIWTGTLADWQGSGSPEGVITAAIGSTYRRTDGGAATSFYVKESGAGNTGWVAYGSPAGSGAPTTATYITSTADGTLSNEFALGSLATGLLRNTTTTGIPTIATLCTHYLDPSCAITNGQLPATITGKTFDTGNTITLLDTLFTLQDNSDNTKQIRFDASSLPTGTLRTLQPPNANTRLMGDSDFAGTTTGPLRRTGTAAYTVVKDNLSSTADPTVNDDTNAGYSATSLWVRTDVSPRRIWILADATAAAANWISLSTAVEIDTLALVCARACQYLGAVSFATGMHIGESANVGWRIYSHPTNGPTISCVVGGVEGDCDRITALASGKKLEYRNSAASPILTLTESTGALTNVKIDAEGTGNTITTVQYSSINAAGCNNATASPGMDLPTANAPTPTCFGTTTTQGTLTFADGSTQTATRNFRLRPDWSGAVDVDLIWFANSATTNAVRWSVAIGCVADSEAINTGPSYNAASASNTAYTGTANQRKTTSFTSVATTNCSAGESAYLQVQRVGADGGDTLTASAELLQIGLKTRAAQ